MPGQLRLGETDLLSAEDFAKKIGGQSSALALTDRHATTQVRQRKGGGAIATVGGPQQREERGVLRDGQELAVAKRPSFGREIEGENADFSNKWVCYNLGL